MRIFLDQSTSVKKPEQLNHFITLLQDDAAFLKGSYPSFDLWFFNKVVPGILSGERTALIEMREEKLAGFMILKHDGFEKKLCTLRIRPEYESRGMGVRLFDLAFEILKTERPLLSVSESVKPKFENLFKYFGFSQEAIYEGRYRPSVRELSFNGLLDR
jgi:ribosomal protein S18 acetylase RimI-like enzyme